MGIKRWYSSSETARYSIDEIHIELAQVINDNCPDAIKLGEIKNQFGRKVAIVSSS